MTPSHIHKHMYTNCSNPHTGIHVTVKLVCDYSIEVNNVMCNTMPLGVPI